MKLRDQLATLNRSLVGQLEPQRREQLEQEVLLKAQQRLERQQKQCGQGQGCQGRGRLLSLVDCIGMVLCCRLGELHGHCCKMVKFQDTLSEDSDVPQVESLNEWEKDDTVLNLIHDCNGGPV